MKRGGRKGGGKSSSIGKAIELLRMFVDRQEEWGVRELAMALGQPVSSVHRLLKILERDRLLEFDATNQKYRAGVEALRWSVVLSGKLPLSEFARPIMADLVRRTGEVCWLSLYDSAGQRMLYIGEQEEAAAHHFDSPVGRWEMLWSSAAGLSVLASLPKADADAVIRTAVTAGVEREVLERTIRNVRINGYVVRHGADLQSPVMISAPIIDVGNVPLGSLSLAVPLQHHLQYNEEAIGGTVSHCAAQISRAFGSQILGGGYAGGGHQAMGIIAGLLRDRFPGARAWAGGVNRTLTDLQEGRGGYGFAVGTSLRAAFEGRKPFTEPHDKLRIVCGLGTLYLHIVARADLHVRSLQDLKGRRVSAGDRGFATEQVFRELLRRYWRTTEAFEKDGGQFVRLSYAEANRAFAEGNLDAIVSLTSIGNAPYLELVRSVGVELVSLDDLHLQRFLDANPQYEKGVIPGATYGSWPHDTTTIRTSSLLVTTTDRAEDEVYSVARSLYERQSEFAASRGGGLAPTLAPPTLPVPLHPGARRFLHEKGLLSA